MEPSCHSNGPTSCQQQQHQAKKIFIQRDYSAGTMIKFQTKFPAELEGLIERQHFDHLVNTLNKMYHQAETSWYSYFESCLACLSAYLLYICIETHFSRNMRKISAFIDNQNDTFWEPRGLHVVDPIERGLRVIEIVIRSPTENPTNNRQGKKSSNIEITSGL